MKINPATGLVDFRILFASEEEQIKFVRHGIAGLSGRALKNVLLARKLILSFLFESLGRLRFKDTFYELESHPLFSFPGLALEEGVATLREKNRARWGRDLLVALGSPSSEREGQVLFFNLHEADTWQLACFHEGDIACLEAVLKRRERSGEKKYRLELNMAPFGFPSEDYQVAGSSWMLPLALACHNKEGGFVTASDVVFSGGLSEDGKVSVEAATGAGKWRAAERYGIKSLYLPEAVYGEATLSEKVDSFAKALTVNESINIFSVEGKTDRQVVSTLRQSSVSQRDWRRTLPLAKLFHQKLLDANLEEMFPATFDYSQRLLASALLHTGQAEEAHEIMQSILSHLKGRDVSSYLHLDILEDGDEWLRYAFDYFFTESTVLSKLGLISEAISAIDERLKDLEKTTELMKEAFGLKTSQRLEYTWVKGLFTKVICLIERSVALYELDSLNEAWVLCQNERYHNFFETFLGMPEEELPDYLTVEAVIRSFNYTVDVALELHIQELLSEKELSDLNIRRQRILEHWGEQPHDMFFGISCLKIDNMLEKLNTDRKKRYREFFWNFRDSSFYPMANTVMDRLNV